MSKMAEVNILWELMNNIMDKVSDEEFDEIANQLIKTLRSNVRADILMKMFKNTRWKFIYQAWHEKRRMIALRNSFK
jgi:hypothetical protein